MSSFEIFAQNVRALLTHRNLRLKDLAEKIGLSESYLSLVLNGTKRNLGDEYKDRIAAFFGLPMSYLYTENPSSYDNAGFEPVPEGHLRTETKGLIDAFLERANLESRQVPFYLALAALSDHEAHSVKKYFSRILGYFEQSDSERSKDREFVLLRLNADQRRLLLACSLAGNNARMEWIESIVQMEKDLFADSIEELVALDLVSIIEDIAGNRVLLRRNLKDVLPSKYTQDKLRLMYLDLSAAMEAFPDDEPRFFLDLARVMVKAGLTQKAVHNFQKAANEYEKSQLWDMAARAWHEASIAFGILNDQRERGKCLCKYAACLGHNGDLDGADLVGGCAFQVFQDAQLEDMLVYVCLAMGNVYSGKDYSRAASWYKKGLASAEPSSPNYGHLLMNLATASFAQGKIEQAESALNQARGWIRSQKPPEANRLASHVDLMSGLIEFKRRNWKMAKGYYLSSIKKAPERYQVDFAVAYHNLGMILYREDRTGESLEYLYKAQKLYLQDNLQSHWAYAGVEVAKALLREGRIEEASALLERIPAMLESSARTELGWVLLLRACMERSRGAYRQAKNLAARSIELFQQDESSREIACASLWLSNLLEETGDRVGVEQLRNRAYSIYSRNRWDLRELHRECSLLNPRSSNTGTKSMAATKNT